MDTTSDFEVQSFHTPREKSATVDKKPLMPRQATPFRSRISQKNKEKADEPKALFNSVKARPFFTIVLFAKLALISVIAHFLLAESMWRVEQNKDDIPNPLFVVIPLATGFILLAMVSVGTGHPLLLVPYLIIQLLSNILLLMAIGSISWHYYSKFLTKRELGIALSSLLLPLWMWTYVTVIAMRIFLAMCQTNRKMSVSDVEKATTGEEDIILFERPHSPFKHENKKRVRFADMITKKKF